MPWLGDLARGQTRRRYLCRPTCKEPLQHCPPFLHTPLQHCPPKGHRAVVALPLGSARCPGGTQSACEATCTYLNLGLHFSAHHFCISPLGPHFSQHFTSCTYYIFLHFTPCTYFPARHFNSCTHSSALPFLHLLSCTLSWSGVPPGVKFPPENAPFSDIFPWSGGSFKDFPHEG